MVETRAIFYLAAHDADNAMMLPMALVGSAPRREHAHLASPPPPP